MANHLRRQLREAVAAAVTGLTTTSTRVYQARTVDVAGAQLPCLLVYVDSEEIGVESIHAPALQRRSMTVNVVGLAKAASDLDDTLDQIGKEVEIALGGTVLVAGKPVQLTLTSVELSWDGSTDRDAGSVSHTYVATIYAAANAPDALA